MPGNYDRPDGRDHVCSECLRVFDTPRKLADHVARTHEAPVEVTP